VIQSGEKKVWKKTPGGYVSTESVDSKEVVSSTTHKTEKGMGKILETPWAKRPVSRQWWVKRKKQGFSHCNQS